MNIVQTTRDLIESLSLTRNTASLEGVEHVIRVANLAKALPERMSIDAAQVGINIVLVELSALLHEFIAVENLQGTLPAVDRFLHQLDSDLANAVCSVVHSAFGASPPTSWEARLLHDADLLDTMGAGALVRAFQDAGRSCESNMLEVAVNALTSAMSAGTALITQVGRDLADERLAYMEQYVARLREELAAER